MEKKVKIIIVVVLIIILLGIGVFAFSRGSKNENLADNNVVNEENIINNVVNENIVQNEVEEIVEDPVEEETPKVEEQSNTATTTTSNTTYQSQKVYESNENVGTTDKKEQAINLVKEYWGQDDDATFRCDSVTTNGEYIIAVSSKKSATVSGFFRVNLENKTVEVEF